MDVMILVLRLAAAAVALAREVWVLMGVLGARERQRDR